MVSAAPKLPLADHVHELCRALAQIEKPTAPTAKEKAYLWDVTFSEMDALIFGGSEERQARRQVFRALADSGVRMAKSTAALEMAFSRNLARWKAGDCKPSALADRRTGPRDDARAVWPDSDLLIIKARAVEARGRLALGVRNAMHGNELSAETTRGSTGGSRRSEHFRESAQRVAPGSRQPLGHSPRAAPGEAQKAPTSSAITPTLVQGTCGPQTT